MTKTIQVCGCCGDDGITAQLDWADTDCAACGATYVSIVGLDADKAAATVELFRDYSDDGGNASFECWHASRSKVTAELLPYKASIRGIGGNDSETRELSGHDEETHGHNIATATRHANGSVSITVWSGDDYCELTFDSGVLSDLAATFDR